MANHRRRRAGLLPTDAAGESVLGIIRQMRRKGKLRRPGRHRPGGRLHASRQSITFRRARLQLHTPAALAHLQPPTLACWIRARVSESRADRRAA